MRNYKLDDFEFSQPFLYFCHKMEASNLFLERIIKTAEVDLESPLVQSLLKDPASDLGVWSMAANLIMKYGLVPKVVFPDSAYSENTMRLGWILTYKLRDFACKLRNMKREGADEMSLRAEKKAMLSIVYRILCICLGEPPKQFDWEFRNNENKFVSFKNLTPKQFYKEIVKKDVTDYVSIFYDPRHDYNKLYGFENLEGSVGGLPIVFLNLPIEELKEHAIKAIKSNTPVVCGADSPKFRCTVKGVMDLNLYDYKNAFGVEFGLDKADLLRYAESIPIHSTTISGVHLEDNKPVRWKLETSWGGNYGKGGYFSMTDDWFSEYLFFIVVDKKKPRTRTAGHL